jgi:hypothetical protein
MLGRGGILADIIYYSSTQYYSRVLAVSTALKNAMTSVMALFFAERNKRASQCFCSVRFAVSIRQYNVSSRVPICVYHQLSSTPVCCAATVGVEENEIGLDANNQQAAAKITPLPLHAASRGLIPGSSSQQGADGRCVSALVESCTDGIHLESKAL